MEDTHTATSSAEPDQASLEDQVWLPVEHHRRASYTTFLAPTDDEVTREEERQPQSRRRPRITSGTLGTADTTTVQQVIWPHELVFTPDGQPATYHNLSFMAVVNGYFSIMAQQMDTIRNQMATHLQELTEDGEIFGFSSGMSLPCILAPASGTR